MIILFLSVSLEKVKGQIFRRVKEGKGVNSKIEEELNDKDTAKKRRNREESVSPKSKPPITRKFTSGIPTTAIALPGSFPLPYQRSIVVFQGYSNSFSDCITATLSNPREVDLIDGFA